MLSESLPIVEILGMLQMTIEILDEALAAVHEDPVRCVRELRTATAVKWC
jgi:hypothetical protein